MAERKRKRGAPNPESGRTDAQQVVLAILEGEGADSMRQALGLGPAGGDPAAAAADAKRRHHHRNLLKAAHASFAGCRPIDAAVLANCAASVKLLASIVDVDKPKEERLDEPALRRCCPMLPNPRGLSFAFMQGSLALHAALRLQHWAAARALLAAGASPNGSEVHGDTPLLALDMFQSTSLADRAGSWRGMLEALLEAGADPLLPLRTPFLICCGREVGQTALDWLLAAHASGRRPLSAPTAAMALQAAIRHQHAAAYARLVPLVRELWASPPAQGRLPPEQALHLLMLAARHGNEQTVLDALSLGADPSAPQAASTCLLAQAALHRQPARGEALLAILLAVKAELRVEDLLRVVAARDVRALRLLLRIGQPRGDAGNPFVLVDEELGGSHRRSRQLSCPVLLNLEQAAAVHQYRDEGLMGPEDAGCVLHDARRRLDIAEALGSAGYRAARYEGRDKRGPWRYDPLQDEPEERFAVRGANRLLMVALEQPSPGPKTLRRFPLGYQAALRTVLLIAHAGRVIDEERLSVAEMAAHCAWRRQRLYQLAAQEEEAGAAWRDGFALQAWALDRGWVPPRLAQWQRAARRQQPPGNQPTRQRRPARLLLTDGSRAGGTSTAAAATAAAAAGADPPSAAAGASTAAGASVLAAGLVAGSSGTAGAGSSTDRGSIGAGVGARQQRQRPDLLALLEEQQLDAMQLRVRRQQRATSRALGGRRGEVAAVEALQRRLEARLMAGDMPPPALPTMPHPLRCLPADLLLRILRMAAYPLSAWVAPEDYGFGAAAAGGGAGGGAGTGAGLPAPVGLLSAEELAASMEQNLEHLPSSPL